MASRIKYVDDERITVYGLIHGSHARLERAFASTFDTKVGISNNVHEVLLLLARSPEQRLKVTELGDLLAVTTGGATRLVNRVVDLGFAEKSQSQEDRRVQWVRLTPLGCTVVERATRLHLADLQRELFDRISPEERAVLERVFARLAPEPEPLL